jgi:homoserine kinase type II
MAVFTPVTPEQASALTTALGLGPAHGLEPIRSGIENTNYFVDTAGARWVLTLFERLSADELPYYLALMDHLAQRGLPVPAPRADADGQRVHALCGKPAALVSRLPGAGLDAPDLHHCAQLGQVLARLHRGVEDFPLRQPNLRGLPWWIRTRDALQPFLSADQATLLDEELDFQRPLAASAAHAALPRGAVHCDLFRDNTLFDGLAGHEKLTAVYDFYFAGDEPFIYDLAVAINDWCLAADSHGLDEARADALVQAYETERPLSPTERRLLPAMLRAGALRFWLSRLADWHLPRDAELLAPKPPEHFERVLRDRRERPWHPQPPAAAGAA